MNQTLILTVPAPIGNTVDWLQRNFVALLGFLVIMLVTLTIVELKKHKWNYKYEEDRAKALVRWAVLLVSGGFTVVATLIYFIQTHTLELGKIPFFAQNEAEVLGGLWIVYNFKLSSGYKNWLAKISKWANAKPVEPVAQPDLQQAPASPPPSEFTV